jgi:hypothetical protein
MRQKIKLVSATLVMLGMSAMTIAAESSDDITPATGYRNWFHVNTMIVTKDSPFFDVIGGMHNVHANAVGEAALKKGQLPYPDGTEFLTDLHDFSVDVDNGSYVMGKIKGLAVMVKDAKKYEATAAWGFSALHRWRSAETLRDRPRDAMLRLSHAREEPGLRLFNLYPVSVAGLQRTATSLLWRALVSGRSPLPPFFLSPPLPLSSLRP